MSEATKRVLIVDDHPIILHGIQALLSTETDLSICGSASNTTEALRLVEQTRPHVLLVDISMEGPDGIEFTKRLRAAHWNMPVLIMSMHDEWLYAERALHAGANGYIMKQEVSDRIIDAIRTVLAGHPYFSDAVRARLSEEGQRVSGPPSLLETLSDRELEVLRLIGSGLGTQQIADQLHVSVKTIETHRGHLKEKLRLTSGNELVRYAVRWHDGQAT